MKKIKILTALLLIVMLATVIMATLVACDPNEEEDIPSGVVPPDPWEGWEPGDDDTSGGGNTNKKPVVSLNQMDFLSKIVDSMEAPEDVLNIDINAIATSYGETDFIFNIKGNFYERTVGEDSKTAKVIGRNELCLAGYKRNKTAQTKDLVFALYIIGDRIYIDRADGGPLIYLSDFDCNYLIELIKGAGGMVSDLLAGLDPSITNLIKFALNQFLLAKPVVTVNDDKSIDVTMEVKINSLLGMANTVLSSLGLSLPVEIGPIITYLQSVIPKDKFYLNAGFKDDGSIKSLGFSGVDEASKNPHFELTADIGICDKAETDLGLPNEADIQFTEFSFTNLQFAIDLAIASELDSEGKEKSLDVGKLINGFIGTANIPEGLLLVKGGTGVRLSFKLDLDLNYDRIKDANTGKLADNNKIAIELFLIDPHTGTPVEEKPQLGIYYIEGSFYLNTDNMLPNYLNGLNIKLDASMADLVDVFVSLVTDAIDGVFGLDFAQIRKQDRKINDNGTITLTSMASVEELLSSSSANVVALSTENNGDYKLAAGIGDFITAIAAVLGLAGGEDDLGNVIPPNIYTDDTSIKIAVNNNMFKALGGLIPQLKGIKLPDQIGDVILSVNTAPYGIDSVTVSTKINNTETVIENGNSIIVADPAFGVELKLGSFYIGFEDEGLGSYIDTRVDLTNTNYLTSLNSVIEHLLGGIRFSSGFNMKFDRGTYDLAPFIAGFGVQEVENSQILWTFDDDFILDASVNLQIALNKTDTAKSMIVLEMKTEKGIRVGDRVIFDEGEVLLGIYGYNNNIYIDISNFNIAGIVLPKLNFKLNFTDLVFNLLYAPDGGFITNLLKQIGEALDTDVTSGDLKFEFNLKKLLGIDGKSAASVMSASQSQSVATSGGVSPLSDIDAAAALTLLVNTDRIEPMVSLATILAILSATGTDLGNTLSEALSLMELDLSVKMGRKDGFKLKFEGELIPKLDDNGKCVYYFDEKGDEIEKVEGKVYKNILNKSDSDKGNVVYYTTKRYNYGSNLVLTFEMGTEDFPIIVGNLGEHKYPIESVADGFEQYKSDLIDAIVGTVGKASVQLDIDLQTLDNEMNITRLVNNILASFGKRLELPISLDLDDWNAHVQLALAWDLDLTRFSNSKIMVELKYEQKNILGIYIHRNSIIIDLTGLGLFQGEIVNSSIVSNIFKMVDGVIKNIGDFDLNTIIEDLLRGSGLPTIGTAPESGADKLSTAEEGSSLPTIGEGLEIRDFISYLTQAIHLENTAIVIDFTSEIINGMLNELVGLNLGLKLGVGGVVDLFGDSFDFGIVVEDITMDASLSLSLGKEVSIPIDFDEVPDWDASSGREFARTLLNNLDIGFTIDLANRTTDIKNLEEMDGDTVTDNLSMYTRIIIEKVKASAGKKLVGVEGTPVAPQGSFVVTLAHINKAMYDDNQSPNASMQALVYIVLDHRKPNNQLTLAICSGLVTFAGFDIGNMVGIQYIKLDLLEMLGPVIDNLFTQIDDMLTPKGDEGEEGDETGAISAQANNEDGKESEPNGLAKVFAELDIIKLLGKKGVMLALRANGTFNVTIEFDTYLINKLIDDIFGQIFAKNTDHESIIDLVDLASNMFDKNYLNLITWTRELYGANGKNNTFWGDLQSNLTPMLKSIVKGLGYGAAAPLLTNVLLNGIYYQVRKIVTALVPFAVWNEASLEINVVDATISNIHFKGVDNREDIYFDNDESKGVAYASEKDGRKEGNFTEIFIYNSSASVGMTPAKGEEKGLVTWADIPTAITFSPYMFTSLRDGVDEIIKQHFTDKTAIYQLGTTIMRADVTFKIVDGVFRNDMTTNNLLNKVQNAGEYKVEATARFSTGEERTLEITIDSTDDGGELLGIEPIEMHAYDDYLPDFLTLVTKNGTRKINTDYLKIENWRPTTYNEHIVEADVSFRNGKTAKLPIHYLDSAVNTIIINGVEGRNVNVNLYEFNISESAVEDYTPETLYFKYKDGKATGIDLRSGWDVSSASELFDRELNVDGKYSNDVRGYEFAITTDICAEGGAASQRVSLIFTVRTKKVGQLTINGAVNTISIDPYEYFMYDIGESAKDPFPVVVEAQYYDTYKNVDGKDVIDTYSEKVNVKWNNISGIDFTWDNANNIVNRDVTISMDNDAYPNSSFTWEFPTSVSVLRNEVEAIYFDSKLSQATYFIDPFQYLINGKGVGNFTDHAYVKFTNGAVYYMPIAWIGLEDFAINPEKPASFAQYEIAIGFDIARYNRTGEIVPYEGLKGNLLQYSFVNVRVENRIPKGIRVDGSELVGGTYYIDPVQVLYYGMNPFPERVVVEYMSGKTSTLDVTDAHWVRDFDITLKGKKGLKASLVLNNEYSFEVNVEIINRNNLKSELTHIAIDPYTYTTDERGGRVYDSYADNMSLYQSVGSFDPETFEIIGVNRASVGVFADDGAYFKYKLVYKQEGEIKTLVERELEYIKDFLRVNAESVEVVSTEVIEYFKVPIAWNLTEVNYSYADTYCVKAIVQAANKDFETQYKVDVEVLAKKVVSIGGGIQYIMVGGTNLSETARLTKKLTLNKMVIFDDGSYGTYECTIDLTTVQYTTANNATLRYTSDENGNLIITDLRKNIGSELKTEEEIADCALDVDITICSGDIAQTCKIKVHVLDNQVG